MKFEQIHSVQKWMPFEEILEKGIIKLKNSSYIKIIKVKPINYNLKSEIEKEAILNSYSKMFKSINFNLKILNQNKKEDLSKKKKKMNSNKNNIELKSKYIKFIQETNLTKKSSSKNFFIILRESQIEILEKIKIENLQNNYQKIRDLLSRCGNIVSEITEEKEIIEIIFSYFNSNKI